MTSCWLTTTFSSTEHLSGDASSQGDILRRIVHVFELYVNFLVGRDLTTLVRDLDSDVARIVRLKVPLLGKSFHASVVTSSFDRTHPPEFSSIACSRNGAVESQHVQASFFVWMREHRPTSSLHDRRAGPSLLFSSMVTHILSPLHVSEIVSLGLSFTSTTMIVTMQLLRERAPSPSSANTVRSKTLFPDS